MTQEVSTQVSDDKLLAQAKEARVREALASDFADYAVEYLKNNTAKKPEDAKKAIAEYIQDIMLSEAIKRRQLDEYFH